MCVYVIYSKCYISNLPFICENLCLLAKAGKHKIDLPARCLKWKHLTKHKIKYLLK